MTRPHGTYVKYAKERCRCVECVTARRLYERKRTRMRAYGLSCFVDAEPVRQHVIALQASGLGWQRVAAMAGVSDNVVGHLLYRRQGREPSRRMRPENAEKILAVRASLDVLGGTVKVDGTGTRRRLQALIARGWSQSSLAQFIGMFPTNFYRTLHGAMVYASTAVAVRDLYERLWDQTPPESTRYEKSTAARARTYAVRRGYAPPLAWDDDSIDDPEAVPSTGIEVDRVTEVLEEYEHLSSLGVSDFEIASRVRVSVTTLREYLRRAAA